MPLWYNKKTMLINILYRDILNIIFYNYGILIIDSKIQKRSILSIRDCKKKLYINLEEF